MSSPWDQRGDGERLRGILRAKRDGEALTPEQCDWLLPRVGRQEIDDGSLGALLASIWFRGMEPTELAAWTRAMVGSGGRLDLSGFDGPKVDKHSTGGIGDKVSLPLAPILASLGCVVPMISGRGLGHTGGTLDKLEAVPGVKTELDEPSVLKVLRETGCVICAQTREIAPADRVLYALRDRIELVESLPLIASSIVSKKVAEDIDALVLDVKTGSGAFLTDIDRGRVLAQTMVDLAAASGVNASARITWMGRPLGRAVGHTLEIEEARQVLVGQGPPDVTELTRVFAADLLESQGLSDGPEASSGQIDRVIEDGSALERFERMLRAQGATGEELPIAPDVYRLRAGPSGVPDPGILGFGDLREVGYAVRDLGGGRSASSDIIDPAVGIVWQVAGGDRVEAGDLLALVHHRGGRGLEMALERLGRCTLVHPADSGGAPTESPFPEPPLLIERILPQVP